ncbi:rRNA pseudouridine synthase [Streptococcus mutans]|uniref:pseudouridine synthase n=1 Tax=Streptococcus mutans TaxID=1309 RepID=UPI0002B561FE|nr:pseudouridine synthase [Streptococcus mutans]EMB87713.1 putative 16S pseudouridylate synthase [Streptococcus mutans N29]MCB5051694.1 rRNA pseudouridine synthase [Streptococcus mutans]
MRLDKLLGQAGFGSRGQVKKFIRSQQVRVDDELARTGNQNVDPSLQTITVSGKQLSYSPHVYYILNKPAGLVSVVRDQHYRTVIDLITVVDRREGLYPVGRLDRDTEGLVLITNNGPLGFCLLHPKYHVDKTYYVEVNGELGIDAIAFFDNGIAFLDGTVCKPAKLQIISSSSEVSRAYITITEGKFHQVKKMFLAYGVKVTYLKRISFGPFELGDLPVGEYRELTAEEKNSLRNYLN